MKKFLGMTLVEAPKTERREPFSQRRLQLQRLGWKTT